MENRLSLNDKGYTVDKILSGGEASMPQENTQTFSTVESFKAFCKTISTEQRARIILIALKAGIQWKQQTVFQTNWMRCAMAINAHLKKGGSFTIPSSIEGVKKTDKPKKSTSVALEGTFNNRSEFKAFTKKLKTEQRRALMKDAVEKGIKWTRVVGHEGTDWMRCAMAIGKHLDSGKSYTIGNQPSPKIPDAVTPKLDQVFTKIGRKVRTEADGRYIVGEGVTTVKNKWGYDDVQPGGIRLSAIKMKPNLGAGNWVKLETAFADKDKVKASGARWGESGGSDKYWFYPFKDIVKLMITFPNIEISSSIAPTIRAVFEKAEDINTLVENAKPFDSSKVASKCKLQVEDFKMPRGIKPGITPYTHQKLGVMFALKYKKVVEGLAVGLGKTLTAIIAAQELVNQKKIKRAVVISPASVKFNWKSEIESFSSLKVCVLESDTLRKKPELSWKEASAAQVIVVNYDMLRKKEVREKLYSLAPNCVIADEAHKLKNDSKQTQGFKKTWENAEYKWFLTATPFPNGKPKETYNMLSHLRPERVGNWIGGRDSFGYRFVEWERGDFGSKAVDFRNVEKLQYEMSDIVFLRTHKSPDVNSELPKERHTTYNLEMNGEQKKLYKAVAEELKNELDKLEKDGLSVNNAIMLTKMKRLEQIAIDPDMLQKDATKVDMSKLYPKEEWAANTIVEHLDDKENRGVVVFCDFLLPLEKIKSGLTAAGVNPSQVAFISGAVDAKERTAVQEKFKTGELKVVLCTNAAEEGVNLQHGSHTLIHLDIPWVPKSITQREGRVLRQGQPNEYAQFLTPVIAGTVEDRKREKLGLKVGTIESLLGEGSAGSSLGNVSSDANPEKLTIKDIKAMIA